MAGARQKSALRLLAASKETGYIDVAAADYVLDTTGSVTLLNTVAQGAAVTQRVGKKIVMKGLQCRGNLQNGSTANSNDVAFMIVYDKRPTGALRPFRHPRLGFVVGDEQRRQHGSFQHPEASRRHPDRKPDCSGQLDRGDCEEL